MKTAILIDGGFYRKLAKFSTGEKTPEERAKELANYCKQHIRREKSELYRIFYYDCPPVDKNVYHPLLKRSINFLKQPTYKWTKDFFDALKHQRKVALRLGFLAAEEASYVLTQEATKKLFNGGISIDKIQESDFQVSLRQKCVDMKIGIDIATLAYKKQVDQIILIAGDSDFVPAAKLARREGIDFILDPMERKINSELYEHIDGLRSNVKMLHKNDIEKT